MEERTNVEVAGAARLYREASVWSAGLDKVCKIHGGNELDSVISFKPDAIGW